ncbi:COG4705 family protein [Schumannella luteola]
MFGQIISDRGHDHRMTSERLTTLLTNRVPEITIAFWVIKILSTTTGETFADYLDGDVGLGLQLTAIVMGGLLVIALIAQFATRRYTPGVYWTVVVLISIVGTLLTDLLTDVVGVPLWVSTAVMVVLLGTTFAIWFARERTLSIHSIVTRRREAFYWVAILLTFALGTAVGDLVTESFGLGYLWGVILFGSLIGLVALARFVFGMNAVLSFWIAYILTRPFGASLGDLLSQKHAHGGLGFGTTMTSVVFLGVIVALTVYLGVAVRRQRAAVEGAPVVEPAQ